MCGGCTAIKQPRVEPFYAETIPPPIQELRWSNGEMPRSLDPARAVTAPETDIVRALYEGLTDLDSRSLRETPGVADRWESSDDLRVWTFHLRRDARWTNGERVTANDFVRSWKRLAAVGDETGNSFLYKNIVGMRASRPEKELPDVEIDDPLEKAVPDAAAQPTQPAVDGENTTSETSDEAVVSDAKTTTQKRAISGVEAINDSTLRVHLELPDKDLPKLVSHPIFRPVFGDGSNYDKKKLDDKAVTNGAFRIAKISDGEVTLDRSDSYWNRKAVALERVRFIAAKSAESALADYKQGEVDIVTNAAFEPLALKLLAPYEDFRRTPHNALNFYSFNVANAPFDDRRVRQALAISIDRSKLADGDLEGTTRPAEKFLAIGEAAADAISFDAQRGRELLETAGFPGGVNFPTVRLVVNRNETQQRVARSVARMWKQNLNVETELILKERNEIDGIRESGDYDLIRRGVVMPVNDEMVHLATIFGSVEKTIEKPAASPTPEQSDAAATTEPNTNIASEIKILTETDALFDMRAIPLYFPTSYALVKPYVLGFEINALDSPSLKEIGIDHAWRPNTNVPNPR